MRKTIKILFNFWKLNLQGAMAYRVSFLIQVLSMLINDAVMIVLFYFFFQKFGIIWGMDFQWYIRLMVVIIWWYCVMNILFFGSRKISEKIVSWQLDWDLLLPKNLLFRLMVNGVNVTAFGDLLYGIILLFFIQWLTLTFLLKLAFVSIFAWITFTWYMLIFESLSFWIWSSRELSRAVFEAVLWPSHYPQWIFQGMFFKVLFMSVLPVFFVAYLPYNMLSFDFSLTNVLILVWWSVFFFGLGYRLFYKWLKRYESGNTINLNV